MDVLFHKDAIDFGESVAIFMCVLQLAICYLCTIATIETLGYFYYHLHLGSYTRPGKERSETENNGNKKGWQFA